MEIASNTSLWSLLDPNESERRFYRTPQEMKCLPRELRNAASQCVKKQCVVHSAIPARNAGWLDRIG
jgi:hypothetical protein